MVALDERTLARIRDALALLPAARYGGAGWHAVERALLQLERALADGDRRRTLAITSELEGEGTRLARAGGNPELDEPGERMPELVLLRRNRLIHELDRQLDQLQSPDRETSDH